MMSMADLVAIDVEILDNIQFIHEFTWLLMEIKALDAPFVCMLSYFNCISII